MQAGHSKLSQVPEKDQTIVTGNGGPSGTGRRPSGETVLPPPVFIQDNTPTSKAPTPRNTWGTDGKGKINGESAEMKDDLDSTSSNNNPATSSSSNRQTRANSSKLGNPNSILLGNGKNISDLVEVGEMVNVTNQSSLDGGNRTEKISTDKQKSIVGTEKGIYQSEKFVAESTHPESKVMVESELLLDGKLENLSESIGDVWGGNISNGFSKSAVFPVPVSSLSISVWSGILQASPNSDLKLNPYGHLFLPFSELLNLTMPPVDAVGLSPWPKPQSYYKQPNLSLVHGNDVQSTVKKTDTVDLQSELAATTSTSSSSKGETKGMLSNEVGQTDTIHSQQATNKLLSNNINALKQIFPGINLNIGAPSRSADR